MKRVWLVGFSVTFVVVLAAAMLVYLRSRPVVSDDEFAAALEEVERVRASLDDIECERPAILGAPVTDALPLAEVLLMEGRFAECWAAVDDDEVMDYLRGDSSDGFRYVQEDAFRASPINREIDAALLDRVSVACAGLSDEIWRQARTPNRCTPRPPSSEGWRQQQLSDVSVRSTFLLSRAVAVAARHEAMDPEDRLRLLIQGMATARDIGQGPAGMLNAMLAAAAELRLAAYFAEMIQEVTPSPEARAELSEALGVLADMPIDIHAFLASEGVAIADAAQTYGGTEDETRFGVYAAATLMQRLMKSCPAGISVDDCLSHLPFESAEVNETMRLLFGERAVLEDSLQAAVSIGSLHYFRYVDRLEALRETARALQEILRWDAERAAGRCPEVSPWDPATNADQIFVDRNEENLYQLATRGPPYQFGTRVRRQTFYFQCPMEVVDELEE